METDRHITLKRLALAYLIHTGFNAAATEVNAPASRYRVDAAGYIDAKLPDRRPEPDSPPNGHPSPLFGQTPTKPRRRSPPRTAIIECKQHRSDFLRDRKSLAHLLRRRDLAEDRRTRIESNLRRERPDLRRTGSFLFNELESWDFGAIAHGGYRATLRELRRLHKQIHNDTKFCLAAQHRLADRLFILAPRNMIQPDELPRAWGLLEACPALFRGRPPGVADLLARLAARPATVTVKRRAEDLHPPPTRRHQLLRNIAVRATTAAASPPPAHHAANPPDPRPAPKPTTSAKHRGRARPTAAPSLYDTHPPTSRKR